MWCAANKKPPGHFNGNTFLPIIIILRSWLRNDIDISQFELSFAKHFTVILKETSTVLNRVTKQYIKHIFNGNSHWALSWPMCKDSMINCIPKALNTDCMTDHLFFNPEPKPSGKNTTPKQCQGEGSMLCCDGLSNSSWHLFKVHITPVFIHLSSRGVIPWTESPSHKQSSIKLPCIWTQGEQCGSWGLHGSDFEGETKNPSTIPTSSTVSNFTLSWILNLKVPSVSVDIFLPEVTYNILCVGGQVVEWLEHMPYTQPTRGSNPGQRSFVACHNPLSLSHVSSLSTAQ